MFLYELTAADIRGFDWSLLATHLMPRVWWLRENSEHVTSQAPYTDLLCWQKHW